MLDALTNLVMTSDSIPLKKINLNGLFLLNIPDSRDFTERVFRMKCEDHGYNRAGCKGGDSMSQRKKYPNWVTSFHFKMMSY